MKPGLKNLRFNRKLEPGMAFTIEPGCYFRDFLFEGTVAKNMGIDLKYVNVDKVKEYQAEVQGIRIEDCCYMNDEGVVINLSAKMPRSADEVEKIMAGKME